MWPPLLLIERADTISPSPFKISAEHQHRHLLQLEFAVGIKQVSVMRAELRLRGIAEEVALGALVVRRGTTAKSGHGARVCAPVPPSKWTAGVKVPSSALALFERRYA